MNTAKPPTNRLAPLLAVLASTLGLLLAVYVGEYFWLGRHSGSVNRTIEVTFDAPWCLSLYVPAAALEARIRGAPIVLTCPDSSNAIERILVE